MTGVEYLGSLKKEVKDIRYMQTNSGSYLMLPSTTSSKYDGFFIFEGDMYKIIDNLGFSISNISDSQIKHNQISMHHNSFSISPSQPITLNLDVRKSYDLRQWGRNYTIIENEKKILIKFTKTTDQREDKNSNQIEYIMYISIKHDGEHKINDKWERKEYLHDKQRNSPPYERYIYNAITIDAKKIAISASKDENKAITQAKEAFKKKETKQKEITVTQSPKINLAYNYSVKALDNLIVNGRIFAGLPWFFQFWTRDEAISVGALISQKRYKQAKEILFKQLNYIQPNGRIPNRIPDSDLGSADGTGWCIQRFAQLHKLKKLDQTEKIFLKAKLQYIHKGLSKDVKDFIHTGPQETWMDSVHAHDTREGARIEIQALQLRIYSLLYKLTEKEEFQKMEDHLKQNIKEHFWSGDNLADGLGDFTIRPNIFIAYYIYPELLIKQEWTKCFESSIPKLWLDWGGLSTIDKSNPLYCPNHTGENDQSYHRGDSWYWINNLAAMCMWRLNKARFKTYIDKILEASTNEILWMGAAGHHAEISSASEQKSFGCYSQAWSMAMYIELIHEINP